MQKRLGDEQIVRVLREADSGALGKRIFAEVTVFLSTSDGIRSQALRLPR